MSSPQKKEPPPAFLCERERHGGGLWHEAPWSSTRFVPILAAEGELEQDNHDDHHDKDGQRPLEAHPAGGVPISTGVPAGSFVAASAIFCTVAVGYTD